VKFPEELTEPLFKLLNMDKSMLKKAKESAADSTGIFSFFYTLPHF